MAVDYTTRMNAAIMSTFGTAASYNGTALTVVHVRVNEVALGMSGQDITADVDAGDVVALGIAEGGTLTISTDTYTVRAIEGDDGGGLATLILESA